LKDSLQKTEDDLSDSEVEKDGICSKELAHVLLKNCQSIDKYNQEFLDDLNSLVLGRHVLAQRYQRHTCNVLHNLTSYYGLSSLHYKMGKHHFLLERNLMSLLIRKPIS
jgi:hypothetical protein